MKEIFEPGARRSRLVDGHLRVGWAGHLGVM
jgi:hypothetical protein